MKAEIIAVGTEILLGQIVNTNGPFVSKRLADLGIDVYFEETVGDNEERLKQTISLAAKRSDLVVLLGGLGPTKDDLTKQTVARYLNKPLIEDAAAMQKITRFYKETRRPMTENNRLQALYIAGSHPLKNSTGFAVGIFYQNEEGPDFLLLPGPPGELKPMFTQVVQPLLQKAYFKDHHLYSRVLRFFGIGESLLVTKLADLIDHQSNPTIAPYAKTSEVTLRLTASSRNEHVAKKLLDEVEQKIQSRVGEYLYGYGDQNSLVNVVVNLLEQKKLTISAAESLTAGAFQAMLADVPGVSSVFAGGAVTYSNEAKMKLLKIPAEVLVTEGAVSAQTAKLMASAIKNQLGTQIGISFTGVAGPDELEGNAVGTVWIGLAFKDQPVEARLFHFSNARPYIRERSVLTGLDWLRHELIK
ncbi:competence/damage-inducible protein A [Liquorilactobacillus satsumensis]|uniref:Putative competence-damage inducible protein n=1 Tax=Liquorilactobacillus satsumensis DSM 16230 = JCM 12392 TaxID=1423801 RepID=A0A0R1V9F5_9LACO|nr:competence/damage-inducible protein A [Liquorilactobacillus satsumensis]KRL99698.1 competence damage-inducible protein A [Liquorilactobacillus satsumensis DSM 16230 = JCM 12392]MCC7665703.1 competence/damage-inducible protein A [Liquorilactobacillus satsumensis]MCP9313621.1 competence/damage-inducible protein A [Liquorilactobacillus satsumensis]MCP9328285.1 competence/damage-inducible protein A [Liquorilactobacillus satsumensis]MCP9356504.1 competence/damage-inducible protein A [Liquorilact